MRQGAVLMLAVALAFSVPATHAFAAAPVDKNAPAESGYYYGIPADKEAGVRKVMDEYSAEMDKLYEDIYTKQMELDYLSRNNNTDSKMITDRIADIRGLHQKAYDARQACGKRLQTTAGLTEDQADWMMASCGRGMGKYSNGGPRGRHMGGGHMGGHMRGGAMMMSDDGGCPRWGGQHRGWHEGRGSSWDDNRKGGPRHMNGGHRGSW